MLSLIRVFAVGFTVSSRPAPSSGRQRRLWSVDMVDIEVSDQTGWMPRLISWLSAQVILLVLSCSGSCSFLAFFHRSDVHKNYKGWRHQQKVPASFEYYILYNYVTAFIEIKKTCIFALSFISLILSKLTCVIKIGTWAFTHQNYKVNRCFVCLRFYSPVNTIQVILSRSVNLLTLFLGRLWPPKRLTST